MRDSGVLCRIAFPFCRYVVFVRICSPTGDVFASRSNSVDFEWHGVRVLHCTNTSERFRIACALTGSLRALFSSFMHDVSENDRIRTTACLYCRPVSSLCGYASGSWSQVQALWESTTGLAWLLWSSSLLLSESLTWSQWQSWMGSGSW